MALLALANHEEYIWYNSSYWLNLRALWWNYPSREIDGLTKYYYLIAFAFWLQQLVVVNIEERRKDHLQMFTHHVITCALIFASYCYHQTKVGNVILCLMDVVDLFLSLAKILKYLKFRLVCDIAFGAFMIVWFIARHVSYLGVCWSIYAHIPEEVNYGCYRGPSSNMEGPIPVPDDYDHLVQPFIDPEGLVCWNAGIGAVFLGSLLALQGILLIWLSMIVKVAYKVLSGEGADDTRSDDECSEGEEAEAEESIGRVRLCVEPRPFVPLANLPIEKEVGFEEMRISPSRLGRSSPVRRSIKRSDGHAAATTGVSLRGTSTRKELLGRIGCDKGS
jgi:very-long-chain ceramide synthase